MRTWPTIYYISVMRFCTVAIDFLKPTHLVLYRDAESKKNPSRATGQHTRRVQCKAKDGQRSPATQRRTQRRAQRRSQRRTQRRPQRRDCCRAHSSTIVVDGLPGGARILCPTHFARRTEKSCASGTPGIARLTHRAGKSTQQNGHLCDWSQLRA